MANFNRNNKEKRKSYAPLIAIGLTWIIYAICLPLHSPLDFLKAAACSFLVWLIVSFVLSVFSGVAWVAQKFSEVSFPTDAPHSSKPLPTSGVPETDAVIEDAEQTLATFNKLSRQIKDMEIRNSIDRMSNSLRGICEIVAADPDKMPKLKKFFQYFLPTTVKLLERFALLERETTPNLETVEALSRIRSMMKENVEAYERQRERLRRDDIFDIHTDITVMQSMMAREGLTDDMITNNSKKD